MVVKFSKWVVSLIIFLVIVFTIGVLLVFWHTGTEPVALVGAFFSFVGGELWMLSGIKKAKVKREEKDV